MRIAQLFGDKSDGGRLILCCLALVDRQASSSAARFPNLQFTPKLECLLLILLTITWYNLLHRKFIVSGIL